MIDKRITHYPRTFIIGFFMGAADIVPGVSGGTIAFISGIYEELIFSIKRVTGVVLKRLAAGKIKKAFRLVPFKFLIPLGVGMLLAIATLASILSSLLEAYPTYLWSFFFGLVLASIFIVRKRVVSWDISDITVFVIAAIFAYFIVGLFPAETPSNLLFFFLSGAIAICAMILPGISGSFLLIIMGKYSQILNAVVERDFLILGVFTIGAVIGIAIFSRVLSWLFRKHHDIAIAVLTGFMLGSLRKLWPWKEAVSTRLSRDGHLEPVVQNNVLPTVFNAEVIFALMLAVLGAVIILLLGRLHVLRVHEYDVESEEFIKQRKKALESQKHS